MGGYFDNHLGRGGADPTASDDAGLVAALESDGLPDGVVALDEVQNDRATGMATGSNGEIAVTGCCEADLTVDSLSVPGASPIGKHLVAVRLPPERAPLFAGRYPMPGDGSITGHLWPGIRPTTIGPDGKMHVVGWFAPSRGLTAQPMVTGGVVDGFWLLQAP